MQYVSNINELIQDNLILTNLKDYEEVLYRKYNPMEMQRALAIFTPQETPQPVDL